ncbi:hypothetical protein E3N88_28410 [Mikania micrantha]|uniref:No apical meristem-associated C-terminal domain-containing protein n=1 Tax=Mikania micrantha TaxID=192012 RepID=A0A5N6MZD0_9ASTR|nr:hypothetical protein E3N88_28410 [Mikania micrantha]
MFKSKLNRFNELFLQVKSLYRSGWSDDQYIQEARQLYINDPSNKTSAAFTYEHVWNVVKEHGKYNSATHIHGFQPPKRTKTSSSGAYTSSASDANFGENPENTISLEDIDKEDFEVQLQQVTTTRPIGRDKAKAEAKAKLKDKPGIEPSEYDLRKLKLIDEISSTNRAKNDEQVSQNIPMILSQHFQTLISDDVEKITMQFFALDAEDDLFGEMPQRDLVTWNSILAAYATSCGSNSGNVEEGFHLFRLLVRSCNVSLTKMTFAPVLKLCLMSSYVWASECVHGYSLKIGLESEVFISGALVNIYIKFGKVNEARVMFDDMAEYDSDIVLWNVMLKAYILAVCTLQCVLTEFPENNDTNMKNYKEQLLAYAIKLSWTDDEVSKVVSWNKIMSLYCQFGDHCSAIKCFLDMNRFNVKHDDVTCIVSLATVVPLNDLKLGEQIHGMSFKLGLYIHVNVSNSLIYMYSKIGCLTSSSRVFFEMEETDIVSWNSIINSYVQSGLMEESFDLYIEMLSRGLKPDHFTLASVLRSCSSFSRGSYLNFTQQIHAHAMKNGLDSDTFVSTTLVDSYSRNGKMEEAEFLFVNREGFDLGSCNVMMFGYINSGDIHKACELFTLMHKNGENPDDITLATMAKACALLVSLKSGKQVHGYAFKLGVDQDLYLSSGLLDIYIKCGDMEDAHQVFDEISYPDEVSWTSMILGCVENSDENHAFVIYHKMRQSSVLPDEYTFATLIKACSYSTALEQGRQIHANAIKLNCGVDAYVRTLLIDFYAKCLAQYGHGKEALDLFNDLKSNASLMPDRVTFIGVLSACSHSGLISEAYAYFDSMVKDYGIKPEIEHYSCLVDALGRGGLVKEAESLITTMPFEASSSMYRALLGACRVQGDMETRKRAATKFLELEPFDSSAYVLLSNIYAGSNQ